MNVLIVGGTSGIGLGFVHHCLSHPQVKTLYATYRHLDTAQDLLQLQAIHPARLQVLPLDVLEESSLGQALGTIQAQTPHLHLILYCVGILHGPHLSPEKSLQQVNAQALQAYFQINSIGGILLAKYALPLLRHRDRSILGFISARVGSIEDNHLGGWYGYRASKAALNMFVRSAAIEYGRKSPQTIVVSLHPGTTDTKLSQPFQRNVPPEKLFSVDRTVRQLWQVLERLDGTHSGQFFAWDGSPIPW
ncbi:SDR family NAD(P)-dependent oxidoreductase [Lyngbya confervoides]|uniref:SDR family NAD(P)-dependent oxidoreductase n=1 Tax=Lyngbya confervoides BDU141951 TaxID=1574623 RepID=A0ABD4T230_9CYAN|nr:SDR family NAD(P)-dependent oxidoreductase [Lyngbya confervoides]MCM1982655.1 SDR family NAD(P)-dependent oxidoreductase [Lyngbya confervoides BDU141951]